MKIPLTRPYIDDRIKQKVLDVLDSRYISEGPVTRNFEENFKNYIGCKLAIAVTSGTVGLEIALRSLKIGKDDEVIVPDFTYPATADVVSIVGAKTKIVDINKETMLIDYDQIEKNITKNTKVIIPVSEFGNPLDYERLNAIKDNYGIYIIEDAACALGSEYKNKKTGNWADITVFSFHPRKFITTGEGGMITTNNDALAKWMNSYKRFGMASNKDDDSIQFEMIGTNYKLSDILSAIGITQLERMDELLNKRIQQAESYKELLKTNNKVILPRTTHQAKHSYQSFCVFINNRDSIMKVLRNLGIEVQIGTYSLSKHQAFLNNPNVIIKGGLKNSQFAYKHSLALPLYHELTYNDQEFIVHTLCEKLE